MPRSLTQKEFIDKALKVTKEHYDLSEVVYTSAKTKIDVVCTKDGHGRFLVTPNNFLNGKGCPKCASENRCYKEREQHSKAFLSRCKEVHGDTYIFDKTVYAGAGKQVIVTCLEHDDFVTLPGNFLKGKGCPKCGNKKRGESNKLTNSDFVTAVTSVNSLYTPTIDTLYRGYDARTKYGCVLHGDFESRAKTLLQGAGCPGCARYGYNTNRPAQFYVLRSGGVTKLGITHRKAAARARSVTKSSGLPFEVLQEFGFDNGLSPLRIETALLRELRATHTQPTEKFDGSTECFYNVDHDWLLARINELIEEHTACQSSTLTIPLGSSDTVVATI